MSGKLTLSIPDSLGISDARVSILDHDLKVVGETTLAQPAGSIDLSPGFYAARALLPNGTFLETAFQMPASGDDATVMLSQAKVGSYAPIRSKTGFEYLDVPGYGSDASGLESLVPASIGLESLESVQEPAPREFVLVTVDFDGRTLAEGQNLSTDPSGRIKIPAGSQPGFVRTTDKDGRYFYVAAAVSGSEGTQISVPVAAPGNFAVTLQDPDANLFILYLEGRQLEQLSQVSDYWRRAKDLLADKHEFPIAAAVGAYIMMLVGPSNAYETENISIGNWLDRWTDTLCRDAAWLADGLCIRAEMLARWGRHREALDLLYELPSRGLPLFTPGLRFALDRLSSYRNASGKHFDPADGEKTGALLDRLYRIASNANFDRPILNFREPAEAFASRKAATPK